MFHLHKIVLFFALLKISVQDDLPKSDVKSHSRESVTASPANDSLLVKPLEIQSGRRSAINILIKSHPSLSATGNLVLSSAAHASSMGHSSHTESHSSSSHSHTQSSHFQGGMHGGAHQQSFAINEGSLLSESPAVSNTVVAGAVSSGQQNLASQFNGGLNSQQQTLAIEPQISASTNAQASINHLGQSAAHNLVSSTNSVGHSQGMSGSRSQKIDTNDLGWSSNQGGTNVIFQPESTLVTGNQASVAHGITSQSQLNQLEQSSKNNHMVLGQEAPVVLQPGYLEVGQNQNDFNAQSIGHQSLSNSLLHSQTQSHSGSSIIGVNDIQGQQIGLNSRGGLSTVSVSVTNDGLYANELSGQQGQNMLVPLQQPNSQLMAAVPVLQPQFTEEVIGYTPNVQYYLGQTDGMNILKNVLAVQNVPSFMTGIKTGQHNIHLSKAQLDTYKNYLIQTGLIKLKPYEIIFSKKYIPKLENLQWTVVNLGSNSHYNNLFERNTLFGSLTQKRLPVKLLVPILKIRNGFKRTIAGTKSMITGLGLLAGGMFRMPEGKNATETHTPAPETST